MDDTGKKEIILEAVGIAENLIPIFKINENKNHQASIYFGGKLIPINFYKESENERDIIFNGTLFFVKDYPDVYNHLMGKLLRKLKEDVNFQKEAFSKEYVHRFIDTLVFNSLDQGIEKVSNDPLHIDMFDRFFHENIVHVFLNGIKIPEGSFKIGKVVFKEFTSQIAHSVFMKSDLSFDYFEDAIGRSYAEFRTFAESKAAVKQAKKETERSIDIIQYAVSGIYPESLGAIVKLGDELSKIFNRTIVTDSKLQCTFLELCYPENTFDITLSDTNLELMENKTSIQKLSTIVNKPEFRRSDFERTIIRGCALVCGFSEAN